MRLSYQIPLITSVLVTLTVCVNIFAFHHFMGSLFVTYTDEIQSLEQKGTISPEKLSTILDVSVLPNEKQNEYKEVVNELSNISASLKNISENPTLYIQSGSGREKLNRSARSVLEPAEKNSTKSTFAHISQLIANPTGWEKDTPEWRLIMGLLSRLLITNLCLILMMTGLYFLWIRRVFAPVHIIIDKLHTYIDNSRFQNIDYHRDDEFAPLVSTINDLYHSLQVQETIRSHFLSDISHEIRTPITAVRCYLEAIEDGVMQIDDHTLPLLQNELKRLTQITEHIMEYEHLTHDRAQNLRLEVFDIGQELDTIIHEYHPQLEKNHQKILIKERALISMDRGMCIQILHNIISNFIKYAGANTTLSCSIIKNESIISLIFRDDGVGIPEEEIHLVREKFYKVDKSRTHDTHMSMGIGLSIIDHIVRIHGGSLSITPQIPHGIIIQIDIPQC